MPSYQSFEELDCWKRCRKVRKWIHPFIQDVIPKSDFDMIQNIRRAARSTTRNIAEGFGRHHHKENIQYCNISRGSLFEIKDNLIICYDEEIATKEEIAEGIERVKQAIHSINGYTSYLKKK